MATKSKKKGKRSVVVDMSKAQGRGGRLKVPEGDYAAKTKELWLGTAESSGNQMIVVQQVGTSGKLKGKEFRDYFSLSDKALWKLRGFLEALEMKVPKKKTKLDLDEIQRKAAKGYGVTITDDEDQNGKPVSRPSDYMTMADLESSAVGDEDDSDPYEGLSRAKLEKKAKKAGVKFKATDSDKKLIKKLKAAEDNVDDIDLEEDM